MGWSVRTGWTGLTSSLRRSDQSDRPAATLEGSGPVQPACQGFVGVQTPDRPAHRRFTPRFRPGRTGPSRVVALDVGRFHRPAGESTARAGPVRPARKRRRGPIQAGPTGLPLVAPRFRPGRSGPEAVGSASEGQSNRALRVSASQAGRIEGITGGGRRVRAARTVRNVFPDLVPDARGQWSLDPTRRERSAAHLSRPRSRPRRLAHTSRVHKPFPLRKDF